MTESGKAHAAASQRPQRPQPRMIALLAACTSTGPIATNLFLPALPAIRADLRVDVAASQTTLSAYLLAYAIAILVSGPVSDRFGRRPLMQIGLAIFGLGSLVGVWAPTLPWLVAGRVVQAIGAATAMTVARAVMGDLFQGGQLASRMALLTLVMVIGTTISPLIGGAITESLSWHAGFWALGAMGLVLLLLTSALLPETRRRSGAVHDDGFVGATREMLAHPVFFGYALQAGVIYGVFLVFIAVAPYLMTETLGRPATDFGLYYMLISAGYFLGNLYVTRFGTSASPHRVTAVGLWLQFASAAAGLGFVLAGMMHPAWLFGPMFPLAFGQGLALPHITARGISLAPHHAGTAASVMGFSQQAVAAISVQAMGFASTATALPVMLYCTIASGLALIPLFAFREPRLAHSRG